MTGWANDHEFSHKVKSNELTRAHRRPVVSTSIDLVACTLVQAAAAPGVNM